MRQTDAIDKYLDAKQANMPEEQAQLFARSWAEACDPHPEMATKTDIQHLAHIMYTFGGAIFVVVCLPILEKTLRFLLTKL